MSIILLLSIFATPATTLADVSIRSSNGNSLLFSEKLTGENVDNNAWRRLYFVSGNEKIDLTSQDRYYIENTNGNFSKKSPSGDYIFLSSVSGRYVSLEDGTEKYVEKAYCSVIDMRDGCIVSDWGGEACGNDWVNNKDVLASSEDKDADVFDYMAMRPSINK